MPDSAKYTSFGEYQDDIDDSDSESLFKQHIQRSPEVCSNCFRKIRDIWFPHEFSKEFRSPTSEVVRGFVRYFISKDDRVERADVDAGAGGQPKSCGNCGSIRGSTRRPLSRPDALDAALNLSETLTWLHVEHNPLLLLYVVHLRNLFPRYATRDDETFKMAVDYATRGDLGFDDVLTLGPPSPVFERSDPFPTPPKLPEKT